jgi:hypothetical protein
VIVASGKGIYMAALIGGVLEVLGLLSGVILLLAPLGIGPATPGIVTWVMFPLLTVAGYVILAMAAPSGNPLGMISRLAGGALLLLALAAIVALFLAGNGLAGPADSTASLWYVAAVGFMLGGVGFSLRRSGLPPQPQP